MKMTYVSKIEAKLKRFQTLKSRRNTAQVLDGTYKSVFKGRSMNFDELREYVQGDDIKDIDWKATARSQKILVRQYIADRKHSILLVFDSNMRMLGHSDGLEEKRELAIMAGGTLAYFVNKTGDYVAAVYQTSDKVKYFPFKTGLGNIELILESYHRSVTNNNRSDINKTLEYIVKNFKRRMIILVMTDSIGINNISDVNLKRLLTAHDVLFLNISDAHIDGKTATDLTRGQVMPDFFVKNKKLMERHKEMKISTIKNAEERLKKKGIPCATVDYVDEIDREIINLLKHR